jgi:hypothetical protein
MYWKNAVTSTSEQHQADADDLDLGLDSVDFSGGGGGAGVTGGDIHANVALWRANLDGSPRYMLRREKDVCVSQHPHRSHHPPRVALPHVSHHPLVLHALFARRSCPSFTRGLKRLCV